MTNWQENLLDSRAQITDLLLSIRRIAVLGIKTEQQANQPAFYVPQYLVSAGYEVIPVPVYYPEVTEILGQKVYRKLTDIPDAVDLVNVFRRSEDIDRHVEEILATRPRAVWFQLGIQNDRAAEQLAKAGIQVVQNRCIMVDHRMIR
jgi:predicted CoA-binding protein